MSNKEESYDENEHDSSDGEDSKKTYESLLSNPSYFSSAMKVRNKMRFSLFFVRNMSEVQINYSAFCSRAW